MPLSGSILATVAPRVLATNRAFPPLTMLPGSPPNGIRSIMAAWAGSTCNTVAPAGLVTHKDPSAMAIEPGWAGSTTRFVASPDRTEMASSTFPSTPTAGAALRPMVATTVATTAVTQATATGTAHLIRRRRRRPGLPGRRSATRGPGAPATSSTGGKPLTASGALGLGGSSSGAWRRIARSSSRRSRLGSRPRSSASRAELFGTRPTRPPGARSGRGRS